MFMRWRREIGVRHDLKIEAARKPRLRVGPFFSKIKECSIIIAIPRS
jgi:hypothetical protein